MKEFQLFKNGNFVTFVKMPTVNNVKTAAAVLLFFAHKIESDVYWKFAMEGKNSFKLYNDFWEIKEVN